MGAVIFGLYGLTFGLLTVRHISYAVLAIICMFAYEQWGALYIPAIAANGKFVNIAILSLAAFAWFRVPTGFSIEFVAYPIRLLIVLLLTYAFVSTSWAPLDANATNRFIQYAHYLAVAVFVAPILLNKTEDFTRVLDGVTILGGLLVVLFAYVPDFHGRGISISYSLDETVSLPLALGDFAGIVMLITMLRLKRGIVRLVWALFVAGSAFWLITKTGSRGQLVFGLAALLICFPARWKRLTINRFLVFVLLIVIAVGTFLVIVFTENTLSSRFVAIDGEVQTGTESRVHLISTVLEAWSSDPVAIVFGLGSSASWSKDLSSFYPHVVPLEVLGELGLIGFSMFAIMVIALFLKAYSSQLKKSLPQQSLNDFVALFGCFVFALLLSCKQGAFIFSTDLLMYAALAEKCFRLGAHGRSKSRRRRRRSLIRRSRSPKTISQ